MSGGEGVGARAVRTVGPATVGEETATLDPFEDEAIDLGVEWMR